MKNVTSPIDFIAVYYDECMCSEEGISKDPRRKWLYSGEAISEFLQRALRFAGWVRNIFIVAVDPLPENTDTTDERIKVIKPVDFMPEPYADTRNINAIELNLYRIDGLSDQFVYFGAGAFLCREVTPDFFFKDGLPRDYMVETAVSNEQDRYGRHVLVNDFLLINTTYNRELCKSFYKFQYLSYKYPKGMLNNLFFRMFVRNKFWGFEEKNFPLCCLKKSYKDFWNEYRNVLKDTCEKAVEGPKNVDRSAVRFYQYATGIFSPYNWHSKTVMIDNLNDLKANKTGRAYFAVISGS